MSSSSDAEDGAFPTDPPRQLRENSAVPLARHHPLGTQTMIMHGGIIVSGG